MSHATERNPTHIHTNLALEISRAAEIVCAGGVVAYPTEAVFGLGCDPANQQAVEKLLALKQRPADKGLILIAADFAQLEPFLQPLSDDIMQRVMPTWPGPVTWLIPARRDALSHVRGHFDTLAVRVTAHPIAAELCRQAASAIVSTSANTAGTSPARSADEARRQFANRIEFVLDGPLGDRKRPTEIRDARTGAVIRAA